MKNNSKPQKMKKQFTFSCVSSNFWFITCTWQRKDGKYHTNEINKNKNINVRRTWWASKYLELHVRRVVREKNNTWKEQCIR
jgi:hypothetical protein